MEDNFFSFFEVPFVRTLNPKCTFSFIKCGIKDPEKIIYATSIHKLSNLTKNEIVLPPKHGGGGGGGEGGGSTLAKLAWAP